MRWLRFPNSGIGAKPPACTISYGQPTAARRHSLLQRDARKGGRLQGARKGLSLAGAVALAAGVAVPWKGSCQRARAAAACAGAATVATTTQRGKEGLEHPLEKG
ncbi:hypothetical protein GW17_00056386 [Ensete ventricosum]|nr:hypothetical protein GW17_00056386 [Ensete ventricosum]